jgi:hypothetical protein
MTVMSMSDVTSQMCEAEGQSLAAQALSRRYQTFQVVVLSPSPLTVSETPLVIVSAHTL